jgi:hypothetical protein
MTQSKPTRLPDVVLKTTVAHTVTYFACGIVAYFWFDYARQFAETDLSRLMRPVSEPIVMAGPLFQPLRGVLFGLVFWLLRDSWMGKPRGWAILWAVLVVIGIINPFGPAPGSIEGLIYTTLSLRSQLGYLPETLIQSLALSLVTWIWVDGPRRAWLTWILLLGFVATLGLPTLGLLLDGPQ